jgi:hypothetical protein
MTLLKECIEKILSRLPFGFAAPILRTIMEDQPR